MTIEDHLADERFIHTDLMTQADRGVETLYESWRTDGKIEPFLLCWPAEIVTGDDGMPINDVCRLTMPDDKSRWNNLILQSIKKTRAYAILLAEQRDDDVRVILESPHGTRCWTMPIERHGDIYVLGKTRITENKESLGLLWRPSRAEA